MIYEILFGIYDILFGICDRLDEAFKRIQELEDRLEAQAAELTEHHNKIDTLEINGSVYESIFEQQGLWGEEAPELPDPEDEEIII